MKIPVIMMVVALATTVLFGVAGFSGEEYEQEVTQSLVVPEVLREQGSEPYSDGPVDEVYQVCVSDHPEPPRIDMRLLGRMSDGMLSVMTKDGERPWWFCGKEYTGEDARDLSIQWAFAILRAIDDNVYDRDYARELNPWGVAGTIANESRFDICALGLNPRKAAYERGALKRNKRTISHTREEVLGVVKSKEFKKLYARTGFDLGPMQLLTRYYKGPVEHLLSWKSVGIHIREMIRRQMWHKTDRPWQYWRSGGQTIWYDKKVTRWAKKMGASDDEI